ncbi:hypothetical protein DSUL_30018 [Desulfovibrionales bacterium]
MTTSASTQQHNQTGNHSFPAIFDRNQINSLPPTLTAAYQANNITLE